MGMRGSREYGSWLAAEGIHHRLNCSCILRALGQILLRTLLQVGRANYRLSYLCSLAGTLASASVALRYETMLLSAMVPGLVLLIAYDPTQHADDQNPEPSMADIPAAQEMRCILLSQRFLKILHSLQHA